MSSRSTAVSYALAISTVFLFGAVDLLGQAGPPPTYDYNPQTPGIQQPASPLIQGYELRIFRTFVLNVPVFVPLGELQAILPNGFVAVANPAGSNTASILVSFVYHQRTERTGGVFGPSTLFVVTGSAFNSFLQRNETMLLANEQSDPTSVEKANEFFGEGTSRLAQIEANVDESSGLLSFRFDVNDDFLNLRLKLRAVGPAANVTRVIQDPVSTPLRALSGRLAMRSSWPANQFDNTVVTISEDNPRVQAPGHRLRLPGGDLTMVALGTTMTIQRWRESFFKAEPEQ
jgi:hypothetical protein